MLIPAPVDRPGISVLILVEPYDDDGKVVCLIHTLIGTISLGPKAWLKAVRDEIEKLEQLARAAGCAEMRIEGRDWSVALKSLGYVPWPAGEGHGLRKALI